MNCGECGAHYLQRCSWWCGLSPQEIESERSSCAMGDSARAALNRAIKDLRVGRNPRVVANELQRLLNKSPAPNQAKTESHNLREKTCRFKPGKEIPLEEFLGLPKDEK